MAAREAEQQLFFFRGKRPKIDRSVFLAPGAKIIGDVSIGSGSSIWFNAVIRGDENAIRIGKGCSIQDGSVLHVSDRCPTIIGNGVTLGHNVIAHGTTVKDTCIIAMGAVLLTGSVIGENSIIAAGAVVKEDERIPPNSLAVGIPAKVVRRTTAEDIAKIRANAEEYVRLTGLYKK